MRVASDHSGKITKMTLPTLIEAVKMGDKRGYRYLTFSVACWCKLFSGVDDYGNEIIV